MYQRFYNSIIAPRNIVNFRNDSLFRVFLYIFFFAALLSTRITIETITFDGLSTSAKEEVMQNFEGVNETCSINENNLECSKAESTKIYSSLIMSFYTDSTNELDLDNYSEPGYSVVLHKDKMYMIGLGNVISEMPISELPDDLRTLDFNTYNTDSDMFFATVFGAFDEFAMDLKPYWATGAIVFDLLGNVVMFIIFILISSMLLRMRFRQIKFKQLFTMTAYSSTGLYLILILNSLYSISFFIVILLLFVAFRQNSQLSMELYRRLALNQQGKNKNIDK